MKEIEVLLNIISGIFVVVLLIGILLWARRRAIKSREAREKTEDGALTPEGETPPANSKEAMPEGGESSEK